MPFNARRIAVSLRPPAVRAVRSGHPWVFEKSIEQIKGEGETGDLAVLFDKDREFVGIGLYDLESPIRVRVLHAGKPLTLDDAWLTTALAACFDVRAPLRDAPDTNGYRLVHGENDHLPGLVLDRYADTIVIKLDSAGWLPHLALLTDIVSKLLAPRRVVLRLSRSLTTPARRYERQDGDILMGPPLAGPVLFQENGITFEADPIAGQKTGFFLDQRENRARVERLAKGCSVLNVFAYTGGFSLYAARGGARTVTSLDLSAPALAAAVANFAHNPQLARVTHECVCADAFVALAELAGTGRRFDLVILDPPSFARKEADIPQAIHAYEKLTGLGLDVLKVGGILVAASCSARVTAESFFETIHRAAKSRRRNLAEMARTTHALDHPIGFPEGAYLKCIFARC